MIDLPKEIIVDDQLCTLNVEKFGENETTLTYEYEPIQEDCFLLSAYGTDLKSAQNKMRQLLKQENLIRD